MIAGARGGAHFTFSTLGKNVHNQKMRKMYEGNAICGINLQNSLSQENSERQLLVCSHGKMHTFS